jgi:hypothetical protein
MKKYYRVMLGRKSSHAEECLTGGFIGADFDIKQDLSKKLPDSWRDFNKEFIPVFLANHPGKSRISAGLACGALWTVAKGIQMGDIVLCPDGTGTYRVGEVAGDYHYEPDKILPHRRRVTWLPVSVERSAMSDALRHSAGSIGTVSNVSTHATEIKQLIGGASAPKIISTDATVEDASSFALEEHLEEFLISNWERTELGRDFDIYEEWARALCWGTVHARPSRRYAAGLISLRPNKQGVVRGFTGLDEVQRKYGPYILDAHLPSPGQRTAPVEAGYLSQGWIRVRHPDYDGCRAMLDDISNTFQMWAD